MVDAETMIAKTLAQTALHTSASSVSKKNNTRPVRWFHAAGAEPMPACAEKIASFAVDALLDEVRLTPKPALVDRRGPGAHDDVSLQMFELSAESLRRYFASMVFASLTHERTAFLRETLGSLGRRAEKSMRLVTGGVNTHRGAIWSIGLLVAAAAVPTNSAEELCHRAAAIARLPDRFAPAHLTHGEAIKQAFGVRGARGEAEDGFPHVWRVGLAMLRARRSEGVSETCARLDALMAIMSCLEDTCLLHRGGPAALQAAQEGALSVLTHGGSATASGWNALLELDRRLLTLWASPGGAADLLAATIFVDRVIGETADA